MKPTLYEQAIADIDQQRKRIEDIRDVITVAEELTKLFSFSQAIVSSTGAVLLTVIVADLREMVEIGKAVSERGLHPIGHYDNACEKFRCYLFSRSRGGSTELNIYAHPKGGKCEFRQVGTKEVPVLELHCEEAA